MKIRPLIIAVSLAATLTAPVSAWCAPRDVQREEANRRTIVAYYAEPDHLKRTDFMVDNYKQHSPASGDGREGVRKFFADVVKEHPDTKQELVQIAADGDLVWVRLHTTMHPGDPGLAVANIFRLENGKIVEHWEVVQPVPESSVSGNSMFSVPASNIVAPDPAREEENRRLVVDFYNQVFNRHDIEGGIKVMAEDYKQHNPTIKNGRAAFASFFSELFKKEPDTKARIVRVAADGDLVWIHSHITSNSNPRGLAVVDIFRVADGKLVEHWDVLQPVPEKSANDNTMF